jgi:hypothetical protein
MPSGSSLSWRHFTSERIARRWSEGADTAHRRMFRSDDSRPVIGLAMRRRRLSSGRSNRLIDGCDPATGAAKTEKQHVSTHCTISGNGAGMRHFPLRECGYAAGFLVLAGAIYVGAYFSAVERKLTDTAAAGLLRTTGYLAKHPEDPGLRVFYPAEFLNVLFSPMHQVDRRLRSDFWSQDAALRLFREEALRALVDPDLPVITSAELAALLGHK